MGGGFGQLYPGLGPNYWADNCAYGPLNNFGGAAAISGDIGTNFKFVAAAVGSAVPTVGFAFQGSTSLLGPGPMVLGMCLSIAPHYDFYPSFLEPVSLPCSPCCTFFIDPSKVP
jgi:hypothetical protein